MKRTKWIAMILLLFAATAARAAAPIMGVEACEGGQGFVHVKGWTYDPDEQDYSIGMLVWVFTDANCTEALDSYAISANQARTDVAALQGIPGNHGFEAYIPLDAGPYWLWFEAYSKDNTLKTERHPYPVTVTASQGGLVTLTSGSGLVTLSDGSTLTGTGGENTRVTIASGATVTLSGVNITAIPDDTSHKWAGITCLGDATIILANGTDNVVKGGYVLYPGIQVGPPGTALTIRGGGSLNVRGNGSCQAAGIGSMLAAGESYPCGDIVIEDGNITAYGGVAPAIGASNGSSCGTITISGGTVRAEGWSNPGIGCSTQSTCAGITITGGTVTASSRWTPAIGSGSLGTCGDITISGDGLTTYVTASTGADEPCTIGADNEAFCGTITIGGVETGPITQNPYIYAPTNTPYTVRFAANDGTGTMVSQGFFSNTPEPLASNTFTRTGYTFIEWNTKVDGTGIRYANGATVNNLGNMTLYAQWHANFTVSFNANGGTGTMGAQEFSWNTTQALATNAFTRTGYTFVEWNTKADGTGTRYADGEAIGNLDSMTLYAQWTIIVYAITYNLDGGRNGSGNPLSYTIESGTITLAEPRRIAHAFDGWTYDGQETPVRNVTIPHGSAGDKTFTVHWTPISTAELTSDCEAYTLLDGQTLTGTGGADTHITIADGATVTLSGVDITAISWNHAWAGITCLGDAVIILADGTTNTVKSGSDQYPGIIVPSGKTLTIRGGGSLAASPNSTDVYSGAAGIGAGYSRNCGNIVIEGGTVTATGGYKCAGIGGGQYGSCGTITITEGVTSVTATRGISAPYSIGAGFESSCGTVTIGGRVTGGIAQNPYTYNPSESIMYTVTFDANGGEGTMGNQTLVSNIPQALTTNSFTRTYYVFMGWNTEADGSGTSFSDGQTVINVGSMTLHAQWSPANDIVLVPGTGYFALHDGQTLSGTGGANTHIVIEHGATVTLCGVDITAITNDESHKWAGISCAGDATIILEGFNNVKGGYKDYPGIHVPSGKTLTIRGAGTLNASSSGHSAGIGGGHHLACGNIVIEGGTIIAAAASAAAGIGGGNDGACGDITITGGAVTATGGSSGGAGIGGVQSCGNITITGGTVTATGGSSGGAGIGSSSSCGNITITEGVIRVTAIKADRDDYPCIGVKDNYIHHGICGTITIAPELTDVTEGNTRRLYPPLRLVDDADNAEAIGQYDGTAVNVVLSGRTLYKDGGWNTLCLPFAVEAFAGTPLEGATVKVLGSAALANGVLTLNFTDATSIEAGRAYLVKWGGNLSNVTNPVFGNVTIRTALMTNEFGCVSFLGDTSPVSFAAGDRTALLIGADGALGIPETDTTVNSCHAWLRLTGVEAGDEVRYYAVDFGDGTVVGKFVDVCEHPGVKPVETCPYCGERNPPRYLDPTDATEPVKTCGNFAVYSNQTALTAGWHVVNTNVQVASRIEVTGNVNLLLCDGAELTAVQGFHVTGANSLTVWAQSNDRATAGRLTVTTPDSCIAGIGGNDVQAGGVVTVNGGVLTIAGGYKGSAIGGGRSGAGGTTTINGGFVTVIGAQYGTGIGGGMAINKDYTSGNAGTTTINGGEVTATGGSWGAAIGCAGGSNSANGGSGGTVVINGGTVTANGGSWSAGIGGGRYAGGVAVEIRGGTVTANGTQAIGDGNGWSGAAGSLTIDGMRVFASADATTPVASADRVNTCHSGWAKLDVCPHEYENGVCRWCGSEIYGYAAWAADNGVSGAWDATDASGIHNVFRYAFDVPTGAITNPPLISISFDASGRAVIHTPPLNPSATGFDISILATDDLNGTGATTYPLDADGETTIPASDKPARFFRLRVEERP